MPGPHIWGGMGGIVCQRADSSRGLEKQRKPRDNLEGMAMLVLSRKKNESIVINNDITIVVVEIRGDKVRLGVEAPKEVPVHRREVYDAIRRNEMTTSDKADADSNGAAES
jgi:carbon storage regulator